MSDNVQEADRIPQELLPQQPKIKHLEPEQYGYVTPWTMVVDVEGYCYLNPEIRIHKEPCGTVSLKVGKLPDGRYFANPSNAYRITFGYGYEWDVSDYIPEDAILVEKVL